MGLDRIIALLIFGLTSSFLFSQNISVSAQDGCPVKILKVHISKLGPAWGVAFNAENISGKPIEAIEFKANDTRTNGSGATFGTLLMTSLVNGTRPIQPSQAIEDKIPFASSDSDSDRDSILVSVDFVLFSDGTRWGRDTLRSSEKIYQMRTGALLYKMQLEQQNSGSPK